MTTTHDPRRHGAIMYWTAALDLALAWRDWARSVGLDGSRWGLELRHAAEAAVSEAREAARAARCNG